MTVREPQKSRAVARQSRTRGRRAKAPLRALSAVRAAASLRKKALWVDAGSLKATAIDWTCGAGPRDPRSLDPSLITAISRLCGFREIIPALRACLLICNTGC